MNIDELEQRASICTKEYDGIIAYVEAFYIHSIIYSASRCLDSFARFDNLKATQGGADNLISLVQEAVGHSAALSRYFWPSPAISKKQPNLAKLREKRGAKLRQAFCLNENSVLFNRDFRNAWEHFDERLDTYFLEKNVGYFFPSGMLDSHSLADDPQGYIFKLLDIDSECLVLLGVKYFFTPLRDAVKEILDKALEAEANGGRLPTT